MNLYKRLCSINLLKRCWHFVREDSDNDFIPDIYKYQDFAVNLPENIKEISYQLKNNTYHAKPLLEIDVPKSGLSVRPGSVPEIQDRIVTYAITYLLAPIIDKKLSSNVYSFRIKDDYQKARADRLFKEMDEFNIPYLKKKTIRKINIVKEWYDLWPEFDRMTQYFYQQEGYKYLSVSDISSYFENINHITLKEVLVDHLPKGQQQIINFLIEKILETWTCRSIHGLQPSRGIPQGNDFSSFLGNIYLIPLDKELSRYARKHDIVYLRYMDDVKVFAKTPREARDVIFLMNDVMRSLQLNLQGAKTKVYEDKEIQQYLTDYRMDKLNNYISEIESKSTDEIKRERKILRNNIKEVYLYIARKREFYKEKDLRLFRRLITACRMLKDKMLVKRTLKEISRNADARLIDSTTKYFKLFPNDPRIAKGLIDIIFSDIKPFEYQEQWFLYALRFLGKIPINNIYSRLYRIAVSKSKHWAVRCQAILLLSQFRKRRFQRVEKLYDDNINTEIRRSLLQILVQEEDSKRDKNLRKFIMSSDTKLNRTIRLFISLKYEQNLFNKEVPQMRDWLKYPSKNEIVVDNIFKLYLLKDIKDDNLIILQKLYRIISALHRVSKHARITKKLTEIKNKLRERLSKIDAKLNSVGARHN